MVAVSMRLASMEERRVVRHQEDYCACFAETSIASCCDPLDEGKHTACIVYASAWSCVAWRMLQASAMLLGLLCIAWLVL